MCVLTPYPSSCLSDDGSHECIRGDITSYKSLTIILKVWNMLNFFAIVLSLSIAVRRVIKIDKMLALESKILNNIEYLNVNRKNSKAIVMQAVAYMSTYTLTILFPLLELLEVVHGSKRIEFLVNICVPAQGIFNLMIFLAQKIHSHRRVNPRMGYMRILGSLFCSTSEDVLFISRLSLLKRDIGSNDAQAINSSEYNYDQNHLPSLDRAEQGEMFEPTSLEAVGDSNGFDTSKWLAGQLKFDFPDSVPQAISLIAEQGSKKKNYERSANIQELCTSSLSSTSQVETSEQRSELMKEKKQVRKYYNVVE